MSYGRFHYRGHGTSEVLLDAIYPVCSPGFLDRHGPMARGRGARRRAARAQPTGAPAAATFPSWPRWFESAGAGIDPRYLGRGPQADSSKVAPRARRRGPRSGARARAARGRRGAARHAGRRVPARTHPRSAVLPDPGRARAGSATSCAASTRGSGTSAPRAPRTMATLAPVSVGSADSWVAGETVRGSSVSPARVTVQTLLGDNAVADPDRPRGAPRTRDGARAAVRGWRRRARLGRRIRLGPRPRLGVRPGHGPARSRPGSSPGTSPPPPCSPARRVPVYRSVVVARPRRARAASGRSRPRPGGRQRDGLVVGVPGAAGRARARGGRCAGSANRCRPARTAPRSRPWPPGSAMPPRSTARCGSTCGASTPRRPNGSSSSTAPGRLAGAAVLPRRPARSGRARASGGPR